MENNSLDAGHTETLILIYGLIQKHVAQDKDGNWYLDLDTESTAYDDFMDYILSDVDNAVDVINVLLHCAVIWLGQIAGPSVDMADRILAHSVDLLRN